MFDADYLSNVLDDLGLPTDDSLTQLRQLVSLPLPEMSEQGGKYPHRLVEQIHEMRS